MSGTKERLTGRSSSSSGGQEYGAASAGSFQNGSGGGRSTAGSPSSTGGGARPTVSPGGHGGIQSTTTSVGGIHSFRTSLVHSARTARNIDTQTAGRRSNFSTTSENDSKGAAASSSYIGRMSRGGLFMFLLGFSSTTFVITYALYMVLTVYGPGTIVVYSGDAENTFCSPVWCKSMTCQEELPDGRNSTNTTALIKSTPGGFDFVKRDRTETWPPIQLISNVHHRVEFSTSDESAVNLFARLEKACPVAEALVFRSMSLYKEWKETEKTLWMSRRTLSCPSTNWTLYIANGGQHVMVIFGTDITPGVGVTVELAAQIGSEILADNNQTISVVCPSLGEQCTAPLTFRDPSHMAILARSPSKGSVSDGSGGDGVLSTVRCTCEARSALYLAVFGGTNTFVILLLLAGFAYRQRHKWRAWRRRKLTISGHNLEGGGESGFEHVRNINSTESLSYSKETAPLL